MSAAAGAVGAVLWVGGWCGLLGWLGAALDRRDARRDDRRTSAAECTPISELLTEGDHHARQ